MEKKIYELKKDIYQLPNLKPNRHYSAREILDCIDCVDGETVKEFDDMVEAFVMWIEENNYDISDDGEKEWSECNGIITFLVP